MVATATPANPADSQGSRPSPDPTVLTTDQLLREVANLKELLDAERKGGQALSAEKFRTLEMFLIRIEGLFGPAIDEKVGHLGQLFNAQLTAMDNKIDRFDSLRLELKADSKTQIDAALLAQKEQATLQDQANQKAIDKQNDQNEKASDKLTELFRAEMAALRTEISGTGRELAALDTRVTKTESGKEGGREAIADKRSGNSAIYAAVGFGITLLLALITIVGILVANQPA